MEADSSIHRSSSKVSLSEESSSQKLLKVVTAFVCICGTMVTVVGVVLIGQIYELQKNRVTEYIEVREDIRDLKKSALIEAEEQIVWRKSVDDRLNSLFKTVNSLVPEVQSLRNGTGNPNPSNPDKGGEPNE